MTILVRSWDVIQNPEAVPAGFAPAEGFFLQGDFPSTSVQKAFVHPLEKLRTIGAHRRQLWVVTYVDRKSAAGRGLVECAVADLEASFEGGADAVVLIGEWCGLRELESTLAGI